MDTLKNIDINVVKIGRTQDFEFKTLSENIDTLMINQKIINDNVNNLNLKLDTIITLLQKNTL
jgi:hypothetical protein